MIKSDFEKFAISNGIGSARLDQFNKQTMYGVNPTILEERQMNVIGLDVFSRLMLDRIIFFGCGVDSDSANIINAQLLYLNSTSDEDIKMFINSPGGNVIDGLSIIDTMNFINPDVATYNMGMCASMGSVLLSSGTKGKRFSLPNAQVMLHQVSGGFRGRNVDIQTEAKFCQKLQNKLMKMLAENCGKTPEEMEQFCNNVDMWLDPEECLPGTFGEKGLIDEIIKKK